MSSDALLERVRLTAQLAQRQFEAGAHYPGFANMVSALQAARTAGVPAEEAPRVFGVLAGFARGLASHLSADNAERAIGALGDLKSSRCATALARATLTEAQATASQRTPESSRTAELFREAAELYVTAEHATSVNRLRCLREALRLLQDDASASAALYDALFGGDSNAFAAVVDASQDGVVLCAQYAASAFGRGQMRLAREAARACLPSIKDVAEAAIRSEAREYSTAHLHAVALLAASHLTFDEAADVSARDTRMRMLDDALAVIAEIPGLSGDDAYADQMNAVVESLKSRSLAYLAWDEVRATMLGEFA